MNYYSMRGLTKPVATRIYRDFENLLGEFATNENNVDLNDFIEENLSSTSFVVDPMSPQETRWSPTEYRIFRNKALAAFARAKANFDEQRLLGNTEVKATRLIDLELYELFGSNFPVSPYEAGSEAIWEYLSLVVLPDLVLERHPSKRGKSFDDEDFLFESDSVNAGNLTLPTRFRGGERNAFRRIWIRANAVGHRKELLANALEDNLVAVFERTRVSQNPKVAKAALVAIDTLRASSSTKIPKFEDIVRDAMKRIVRLMSVKSLDVLPSEDLDQMVFRKFLEAAASFGYILLED